jgi:Ca-activated chloride channel family protein
VMIGRRGAVNLARAAWVAAALLLAARQAGAESTAGLVSRGNKSYAKEQYDTAIEYYDKASVRSPESAIIAFNTGNAYFRKGDYARARELFGSATLNAKDLSLEAKAWYNTGNCAFREGERQVDSDLEKALGLFQESVQLYTTALEKDPGLLDAAHNIEVARLLIKDLLDRMQKQKEQMERQQGRLEAIADSLRALIGREEQAAERSKRLERAPEKGTEEWKADLKGAEGAQDGIAGGTTSVRDSLAAFFPKDAPPPVQQASSHLDSSLVDQYDALENLSRQAPGSAAPQQERGLDQLRRALEALMQGKGGEDQQQSWKQQGQQQEQKPGQQQEQQQGQQQEQKLEQKPRDETAREILDEEKENRKNRQEGAQGYRPVDKDW